MSNNSCHGHCEAGIQLKVIESDDPKSKPSNHQTQSSFATNLGISSWKIMMPMASHAMASPSRPSSFAFISTVSCSCKRLEEHAANNNRLFLG